MLCLQFVHPLKTTTTRQASLRDRRALHPAAMISPFFIASLANRSHTRAALAIPAGNRPCKDLRLSRTTPPYTVAALPALLLEINRFVDAGWPNPLKSLIPPFSSLTPLSQKCALGQYATLSLASLHAIKLASCVHRLNDNLREEERG